MISKWCVQNFEWYSMSVWEWDNIGARVSDRCWLVPICFELWQMYSSLSLFAGAVSLGPVPIPGTPLSWVKALWTLTAWCRYPRVPWGLPGTKATMAGQRQTDVKTISREKSKCTQTLIRTTLLLLVYISTSEHLSTPQRNILLHKKGENNTTLFKDMPFYYL